MSNIKHNKELTRRDMLFGGLRCAILGVIGAGGLAAAFKRKKLLREGKCLNNGICPQCNVFADCGLPRARSIRDKNSERSDG